MNSSINVPKTKRGEITLANIIRGAEKMFGEKGYYNCTMIDIAKEAGVAPGTIYIYFPDKYTLYQHLLSQYSHIIRMHIAKQTKECTSRHEIEKRGLVSFLEIIRERRHMYHIIWESLYIDHTLFVEYYTSFSKRYMKSIIAGQEAGDIIDCDPEILSYMLMGIANFIGLRYILFESDRDLEQVAEEVIRILDLGLFSKI